MISIPTLTIKQEKNLWNKVLVKGPDDCWPWQRANVGGYGIVLINKKCYIVTRIIYTLKRGIDPGDLHVLHIVCDNPPCCNPKHFGLGTQSDNVKDSVNKKRHHSFTRKEKPNSAKLTLSQVKEIKYLLMIGLKPKDLAKQFGVDFTTLNDIQGGRSWINI